MVLQSTQIEWWTMIAKLSFDAITVVGSLNTCLGLVLSHYLSTSEGGQQDMKVQHSDHTTKSMRTKFLGALRDLLNNRIVVEHAVVSYSVYVSSFL